MDYTTPPTWAAFAGLALLAIISYVGAVRRRRSGRRYPPVVGTVFHKLYHFRRLHDYLTDLSRRRKTFRLLAPGRRLIYTCDPAVVEHILRANFANYGKGAFNRDNTGDLLGDGIFAVDGDRWRQQRKIASHEFASSAMRDFSGAVFRTNAAKLAAVVAVNAASKQPMEFQASN
jgi:cytochrome P450